MLGLPQVLSESIKENNTTVFRPVHSSMNIRKVKKGEFCRENFPKVGKRFRLTTLDQGYIFFAVARIENVAPIV